MVAGRFQSKLYPEIVDRLKQSGIELERKAWELEMSSYGKVAVSGNLSEEEKEQAGISPGYLSP